MSQDETTMHTTRLARRVIYKKHYEYGEGTLRTIRAFISDDFRFASGGLDLRVGLQELNESGMPVRTDAIMMFQDQDGQPVNASWRWHYITEEERVIAVDGASLRLEEGVGQALLEALARHYHGTSDTHRMANDLGRERQRRDLAEDRLWEVLNGMATSGGVAGGYLHDILFKAVQNAADSDGVAIKLAEFLTAMTAANAMAAQHAGPPLQFHQSTEFGRCRGHMPWDMGEECRA